MGIPVPVAASMRIAIYCDVNSRGGVWTYTCDLAAELRGLEHEVAIVSHEPQDAFQEQVLANLRSSSSAVVELPPEGELGQSVDRLHAALLGIRPDVFLPNYRLVPFAAAARLAASGCRIVGVAHSDHESSYRQLRRFERALARIVAPTAVIDDRLRRRIPHRAADIVCIPHGVRELAGVRPSFEGGRLNLLYFGRLNEDSKQVSRLLDLAEMLVRRQADIRLTIVGDGPSASDLASRAAAPHLSERVRVLPSVGAEKLGHYIAESHVFVLTSAYEGFCLSLAEGMRAGLPAVAFACGGVIETYLLDGRNGYVCPQGDVSALADRVLQIQGSPELWRELSAAATGEVADKFSWGAAGARYTGLFREALADARSFSWPRLRPTWMPPGRSARSIVERVGTVVRFW